MFANSAFKIAFLISAVTHGAILFGNSDFALLSARKKGKNIIKVNYVKIKAPLKMPEPRKRLPLKSPASRTYLQKLPSPPAFIDKEAMFKNSGGNASSKPAFLKPDIVSIKKVITLPLADADKISDPFYINYYQIVREKIRRAASLNYSRSEEGEVCLSFIILNDGLLKDARLIEEKSSPSPYLRETALKSVKEASPFPAFPGGLAYPQLSFNVIISIQIE